MRRLIVADSHGLYRSGLRAAVESSIPFIKVIEAQSYQEMLSLLDRWPIDLILVNPQLAGITSIDSLRILRNLYPTVRCALLMSAGRQQDVFGVLASGFSGVIFKSQSEEEILTAVCDVLSGRIYNPPVQDEYLDPGSICHGGARSEVAGEAAAHQANQRVAHEFGRLTPRQREVLALIAEGLPNKEIARRLHIKEATTKIHAGALMRVLGVKNRTEAALLVQNFCIKDEDGDLTFRETTGHFASPRCS